MGVCLIAAVGQVTPFIRAGSVRIPKQRPPTPCRDLGSILPLGFPAWIGIWEAVDCLPLRPECGRAPQIRDGTEMCRRSGKQFGLVKMIGAEQPQLRVQAGTTDLAPAVQALLVHLAKAHDYARKRQVDPWEFAVEIDRLIDLGDDKRSSLAVSNGCVQHARESSQPEDEGRKFQSSRNMAFTKETCFVATDLGLLTARAEPAGPTILLLDGDRAALPSEGDRAATFERNSCRSAMGPPRSRPFRWRPDRQAIPGAVAQPGSRSGGLSRRGLAASH